MKLIVNEFKWFQFRARLAGWQIKRREEQLASADRAGERSISILQKRYGYSREQAAIELRTRYSNTRLG